MERKPKGWECAAFVTESGRRVIGCQEPGTFEEGNCNKIRFFSETGRPYYTMDTCSGGLQYAPQDPPKGYVNWYDPLRSEVAENERQCRTPQCGLVGEVPPYYRCARMLDTVDGDVRGCWNPYQFDFEGFCADVQLYDDEGEYIGTRSSCLEDSSPVRSCGKGQCGVPNRVPDDWRCARWGAVSSELDGEFRPALVVCSNPTWEDAGFGDPTPEGICALLFDENNRPYAVWEQCGPGGQQVGDGASSAAQKAFDALGHGNQDGGPDGGAGGGADGQSGPSSFVVTSETGASDPATGGSAESGSSLAVLRAKFGVPDTQVGSAGSTGGAGSSGGARPAATDGPTSGEGLPPIGGDPSGGPETIDDLATRLRFLLVGGNAGAWRPSDSHRPTRAKEVAALEVGAEPQDEEARDVTPVSEGADTEAAEREVADAEAMTANPTTTSPARPPNGEDGRVFGAGLATGALGRAGPVRNVAGETGNLGAGVLLGAGLLTVAGISARLGRRPTGRRPR